MSRIRNKDFLRILKDATETELSNLEELGDFANEYPLDDIGVAQGCCLSPLIGNILLHEFDKQMNARGITCARFIDDFLILGPNRKSVLKAFNSACRLLKTLNLTTYSPAESAEKAKEGTITDGIEFLGCLIKPGSIVPGTATCDNLIRAVDECIKDGKTNMKWCAGGNPNVHHGLVRTLYDLNNIIRGWSYAYRYCNRSQVTAKLDNAINKRIQSFFNSYYKLIRKANSIEKRRLLGVHVIHDTDFEPIAISSEPSSG